MAARTHIKEQQPQPHLYTIDMFRLKIFAILILTTLALPDFRRWGQKVGGIDSPVEMNQIVSAPPSFLSPLPLAPSYSEPNKAPLTSAYKPPTRPPPPLPQLYREPFDHATLQHQDPSTTYQQPSHIAPTGTVGSKFCPDGLELNALGNCVEPEFVRDLFVFQEPEKKNEPNPVGEVPKPQVKLNLVIIRTTDEEDQSPIIIPPPREETLVLVLSKKDEHNEKIIEVPASPGQSPQVYFIDYTDGDNPTLPGGITLQEALLHAVDSNGHSAELVGSGGKTSGGYGEVGIDTSDSPETIRTYSRGGSTGESGGLSGVSSDFSNELVDFTSGGGEGEYTSG